MMQFLITSWAIVLAVLINCVVGFRLNNDVPHRFDLRQAISSTCTCPSPETIYLSVESVTTTVGITVLGSGTISITASPSTETAVSTSTSTITEIAATVTTCIADGSVQTRQPRRRQATDSNSVASTGVTSTVTSTFTETTTFVSSDVETLPPPTTFTDITVEVIFVTEASTSIFISCAYVTIVTVSGTGPDTITTTLVTATDENPGTVEIIAPSSYVTLSSLQTDTVVQTDTITSTVATQTGVEPGTVVVYEPNYVVITATSGTVATTNVVADPTGTQPGTLEVLIPTPDVNCGNGGIQYAIQSNPFPRGLAAADPTYSSFQASFFQTQAPQETGVTNYIGVPLIRDGQQGSIYGGAPRTIGQTAVNHRAYLFAAEDGDYSFDFPASDDISLLWVGTNAYGPNYNRANANIEQLYNGAIPIDQQIRYTYNITLQQGRYYPFRVLWANAGYDGQFQFNIYAPDGELITNGVGSPYIVQFSCDGNEAPPWLPWGAEI